MGMPVRFYLYYMIEAKGPSHGGGAIPRWDLALSKHGEHAEHRRPVLTVAVTNCFRFLP